MASHEDIKVGTKRSTRAHDFLAAPRACRRGEHVPTADIATDASGLQHSRCRTCGCELTRLPVLRRWYRTGMMG
jgi:hypothetical protein